MTSSASTALPELKKSSMKMIASVSGMTIASRALARSRYRYWPAQSSR